MTITSATTIILSNDFNMSKWVSDLLLPTDEAQDFQTVENIIEVMASWNAGEIADAIGSIIGAVCIDQRGEADMEAARLFSESKSIQRVIGLRRRSRLFTQRNLGRNGPALKAVREAVNIAEEVLTRRGQFTALFDRYHESAEDDIILQDVPEVEDTENSAVQNAYFEGVMTTHQDKRTRARASDVDLKKWNGLFRAGRSDKRNTGRNAGDKLASRAMNAYHRRPSMRRECGIA